MLIKDLIAELNTLYNTYSEADKAIMGEPEIVIDVFKRIYPDGCNYLREYAGFSGFIKIEMSSCGVYPILSAFDETQDQNPNKKATQLPSCSWPLPESWET